MKGMSPSKTPRFCSFSFTYSQKSLRSVSSYFNIQMLTPLKSKNVNMLTWTAFKLHFALQTNNTYERQWVSWGRDALGIVSQAI